MMSTDFSPLDTFERSLRAWWLVVVLALLGGLVGWGFFRARQPLYEASIQFTFSLDLSQTGALTDIEEDQAFEAVGDIVDSSQVLEAAAADAAAQGLPVDAATLRRMATRERSASAWTIRLRNPDPNNAAILANLWGERANAALTEAAGHAAVAGGLHSYLDSLTSCLRNSVASEPVQIGCNDGTLTEIQTRINTVGAAFHKEELGSQGMLPGVGFFWSQKATRPDRPVLYNQGTLMLAGALAGIALAVLLIQAGLPDRLIRKARHA